MGVGDGLLARYGSTAGAAAYRDKYDRSWSRRLSAGRERSLLRRALSRAGTEGEVLDVPCGAGRMVPVLLERASRVTALDLSPAMTAEATRALAAPIAAGRVVVGEGSVERIEAADRAFDTAVCWRLLHHLTDPADRARALEELGRVVRRAVIVTFADADAWKARSQRRRGRDRRCVTLTRDALAREARAAGLDLEATWRLAGAFSLLAVALLRPAGRTGPEPTARA
ncbi:MAG TPA: class I SAM-dependent methyltransferase [Planctomycetota bacterium]|nr:class I SAM-dependent methyltransferase [Planctomycetota bacterium]